MYTLKRMRVKRRETNEEYSNLGVHRCSRPRCCWNGICAANPSEFRSQSRLCPACSRTRAAQTLGVQLSAGFSRERVLAAYAVIATRYATLLADKDATIVSSVLRSRGTEAFYQVRVGTDTFESANDLCAEIRRAGGACMVLRNKLNQDNMDGSVYANAIHSVTQF